MKKFFINIICCFIPSKSMRHKIRAAAGSRRNLGGGTFAGLNIIDKGENNKVIIHGNLDDYKFQDCHFIMEANDCQIEIYPTIYNIHQLVIQIAQGAHNSKIRIGKDFSSQQATISVIDKDTTIDIDDNCMLSWGIEILPSDGHTICDKKTNKILNKSSRITLGNHCWIGCKTIILKNVSLPDNTICGAGSVVSKSVSESNCAIAGNPARIVKQNIYWERQPPNSFE